MQGFHPGSLNMARSASWATPSTPVARRFFQVDMVILISSSVKGRQGRSVVRTLMASMASLAVLWRKCLTCALLTVLSRRGRPAGWMPNLTAGLGGLLCACGMLSNHARLPRRQVPCAIVCALACAVQRPVFTSHALWGRAPRSEPACGNL